MTTDDVEFYYANEVMQVAWELSKKTPDQFSLLSYRTRRKWLDLATKQVKNKIESRRLSYSKF